METSDQPVSLIGSKEERTWAMVAHLSAFAGHFFPFANIFAPLLVWCIKKDQSPLVDDQGKEALNAQISYTIYFAIAIPLCFIFIGFILLGAVYLLDFVCVIIGAVAANDGKRYRYPLIMRFVK